MSTNEHLIRQSAIVPESILAQPITVIGCGAVGSYTILQLAKMGFSNITVWDFDKVSIENMSCQNFGRHQIGRAKVHALESTVLEWAGIQIKTHNKKWVGSRLTGLVLACADSMAVRRQIFEHCRDTKLKMIDSRMGAEQIMLYTIDPQYDDWYERTLYSDDDAVQLPCTAKATAYCANIISGLVVKSALYTLKQEATAHTVLYNIKEESMEMFRHG